MLLPAPGLFSITNGWPIFSVSHYRDDARQHIGGAGGRIRHDPFHGTHRIVGGECGASAGKRGEER